VTLPVDGRSDIYSLGIVLCEALGGTAPIAAGQPRPLHLCNSQVGIGLSDVVSKCLAGDPSERYPSMAAFASDLRRHLANLPLSGVRNRSIKERWRKWKRRRPHGVALTGMMLAVLTATGTVALGAVSHFARIVNEASAALDAGQWLMDKKEWDWAISTLDHGLDLARGIPFQSRLAHELDDRLRLAKKARAAVDRATTADGLHRLINRVRFLYEAEHLRPEGLRELQASCRALWENRTRIVQGVDLDATAALEPVICEDLLELAILCGHLEVRLASEGAKEEAHRKALVILEEAEDLFGPNPVLVEEGKIHALPGSNPGRRLPITGMRVEAAPTPAWQHYALGRALLRCGDLEKSIQELEQAVRLQPRGLWPNFYVGLCAYRLRRYADAVAAYSVCVGTAPEPAGCFYNRALAFDALGCTEQALRDYDQALRLDPSLCVAALNRGMLHYRAKRYAAAIADLQRAAELGADPAVVFFDLALANLARGERAAAVENLCQALSHNPKQPDARKLYDRLVGR
jgi:tetratricopeptide (TPR) repeat protein